MEMRPAPQVTATDEVYDLVREDLRAVEEAIGIESAASFNSVTSISRYLQASGAERVRATLLLLCARLAGGSGSRMAIQLGAVVEMLHAASLVHEDVIDAEKTASASVQWANSASVLAGDLLYARAFRVALQQQVLDLAIGAAQMMAMGELTQLNRVGHIGVTEDECLEVADRKTARLFSVCGKMGVMAAGIDSRDIEKLGEFSWNLGMAFQLTDDVLDFLRDSAPGMPPRRALRNGRVTLPVAYALEHASKFERNLVAEVLRDRSYHAVSFENLLAVVVRYGGIQRTHQRARQFTECARRILAEFSDGVCRRALFALSELATERDF